MEGLVCGDNCLNFRSKGEFNPMTHFVSEELGGEKIVSSRIGFFSFGGFFDQAGLFALNWGVA
jgi:hypothetical protein